jgi:hypothetical protein
MKGGGDYHSLLLASVGFGDLSVGNGVGGKALKLSVGSMRMQFCIRSGL